jgi:hypothetical protein
MHFSSGRRLADRGVIDGVKLFLEAENFPSYALSGSIQSILVILLSSNE